MRARPRPPAEPSRPTQPVAGAAARAARKVTAPAKQEASAQFNLFEALFGNSGKPAADARRTRALPPGSMIIELPGIKAG